MNTKLPMVNGSQTLIDHAKCGDKVRVQRERLSIPLKDFALLLGISAPFLSDLERGKRNWTEARFLQVVAEINRLTPVNRSK